MSPATTTKARECAEGALRHARKSLLGLIGMGLYFLKAQELFASPGGRPKTRATVARVSALDDQHRLPPPNAHPGGAPITKPHGPRFLHQCASHGLEMECDKATFFVGCVVELGQFGRNPMRRRQGVTRRISKA